MRNKKFDVDKFADEVSYSHIDTSFWEAIDDDEPKLRINAKCPVCGSTDWWNAKRSSKGKILKCSECPND